MQLYSPIFVRLSEVFYEGFVNGNLGIKVFDFA